MVTQAYKPRVLMFSQRNIFGKWMFRCPHFEFEDIISQVDSADLLAPQADPSRSRYKLAKQIRYHAPFSLNPGIQKIQVKQSYDLFMAVCGVPTDLLMIDAAFGQWRDVCKTSVCLIDEIWANQIAPYDSFLRILERFDVVMLYYSQTVGPLAERIGPKCFFLPPGIDTVAFCPYPQQPSRVVDVCSIGRRGEVTHQRLLKMASENGLFYLHDSISGSAAIDSREHRTLFANIAKRSRYFIVNPGYIDRPDIRGTQIEASNRYYEGAASGAILIGERPNNEVFETLFDWPDALIHLPYNSDNIDAVIHELDKDPERQERICRTNVARALMKHDWVYRWEAILNAAGLEPMPELFRRKERLKDLADAVSRGETTAARKASECDAVVGASFPSQ
jgi:Glycosyl transferases group 1